MDKELLELELDTFIDWLSQNADEPDQFDLSQVSEGLLKKYMLERAAFMTEMKKLYPSLYADVVLNLL